MIFIRTLPLSNKVFLITYTCIPTPGSYVDRLLSASQLMYIVVLWSCVNCNHYINIYNIPRKYIKFENLNARSKFVRLVMYVYVTHVDTLDSASNCYIF